ncbi:autotransporter outer membrane beta-barrel domain-containing protein, partial [Campylobacter ureolyticus]|uniref:autotransporter outer membrane beta-barrel domain-containing protein n=1 Tax=Campylobacter ureolyticus TaxID=827 RepID=UPI0022B37D2C
KKQGGGHLILSGKNSYEGPTRTVGGVIQLRGNNYKKASIKGDTYVENQNSGMIISDAIVEKNAFVGNNGILQIENSADIYGKVIAYNGGALNSMKDSTLKTSEVIITQNGILTGAGNIVSDVSLNDGIITRANNLNMNKLNANYGNNNIYSSSINLRSGFNNNYNSSLNIFGDVALNLNAQNTFNNYGKLNIKNRLIIQSNNDFINYQGANLNLDNKESILYTAGNFVNKGRLSFTGQRADELGKIMAGKKAFLRETQNLNLNLNNNGINIINNQYRGGLGVEIIRTAQGIDQEINKNLITLNNGASYLLDLSTQKDSNGKSLYFIMKTKNQYTNRNFRSLARSYQNQAYALSAQNNIAANNYINSINNINTKTEQTNQAIINRKNENSKQILAKLDDRDINIMDSLLFSNEGSMQDGIVTMLEVALGGEEESKVFKDISSNIKNNKPFSSTQTQAFNIHTKRAVNTNIMLTPTKNSPVKMANNMKKLDGVKLASNGNDMKVLLSAIEEEIYKNSFNISAIGTKNSYSNNDYDFVGGVVNFNKMFESQMVGGYFSYAKANVDQNVDIKSDLFEIGAYLRQYIDSHEIDFTLGYGIGNNKANYNIKYGVDTASYDGKYDSKYFTAGTSYGYKFNLNDGFSFKPFIGFDYFNYTQDSFTASTNHKYVNYNQNFNKAHFKNLQANLGAELIHNNKDITIYARPYIARDIYQSADDLISSFGTANQNFKIDHDNKKRTSFAIYLGIQKEITDNFLIDAGAGTYINNQNRAYNGQLGFTYRF